MRRLIGQALVFTVVAPCMLAGVIPSAFPWVTGVTPAAPRWAACGYAAVAFGVSLYACCVVEFVTRGGVTPAPYAPPQHLVTRGPYRVVRNPMYVAVTTVVAGLAVAFATWILAAYGVALLLAFHLRVLRYEEPGLERLFGGEWETYRRSVGRWLPFSLAHKRMRAS